jgi:[acyl-carrier-protein] S-malonyltransferase
VKGVEAVEAKAKSFKARMTVRLAVAGAFHTQFMGPAVEKLEAALATTDFKTPRIPVILTLMLNHTQTLLSLRKFWHNR